MTQTTSNNKKFFEKIKPKTINIKIPRLSPLNSPLPSPLLRHNTAEPPRHPSPLSQTHFKSSEDSEMSKNNAFEVKTEHPMDEPITLTSGKKIFPNESLNDGMPSADSSSGDFLKLIESFVTQLLKLVMNFYNLDWYVRVIISEKPKKIHVPTIIISVLLILLYSMTSNGNRASNDLAYIATTTKNSNTAGNSSSLTFTFILIAMLSVYFYINKSNDRDNDGLNKQIQEQEQMDQIEKSGPLNHDSNPEFHLNRVWSNEKDQHDYVIPAPSLPAPPIKSSNNFEDRLLREINRNQIPNPSNYPKRKRAGKLHLKPIHYHNTNTSSSSLPMSFEYSDDSDFEAMKENARNRMLGHYN